jgi:hypothetical protein
MITTTNLPNKCGLAFLAGTASIIMPPRHLAIAGPVFPFHLVSLQKLPMFGKKVRYVPSPQALSPHINLCEQVGGSLTGSSSVFKIILF